jgi:hypothetical protein
MTNIGGVWVDTIMFFIVVVVMALAIILCVDDLTFSRRISEARKHRLLGYSTFRCIAETPIVFVMVAVINLVFGLLSIYVFDKSINMALSIIIWCLILCPMVFVFVCLMVVAPISKLIYYCHLIIGKPNTLAGYYAYRMMQAYPTTITTKHFDLGIYHFDKEQFNKRLVDGEKIAESMDGSSKFMTIEDKTSHIDDLVGYSMYH